MTGTDLVLVKSFGDLVIAATVVGRMAEAATSRLIVGEHLTPLLDAVGTPAAVHVLAHGEDGVPAMYDVRRCGRVAAMRSAWRLRRLIAAAGSSRLLFDRVGVRERWLGGGVPVLGLPDAPNIYLAYEAALAASPSPSPSPSAPEPERGRGDIGVFPGSRIAAKNLSLPIVEAALAAIKSGGLTPQLLLLEAERPDLEASGLPHRIVPRSLAAMVAAVRSCSAIVSADSMPAHVAERFAIPVHVISPVDNRYWLPRSAFFEDRWSLFKADTGAAVAAFLADLGSDFA